VCRLLILWLAASACASVGPAIDETLPPPDFDGDGIPDDEDDDADGDGIPDDEDDFVDLDRDGYDRVPDCDDADASVNPGATEVCGNGKDDDCDGSAGRCRFEGVIDLDQDAALTVAGETNRDGLGNQVIVLGDVDQDGSADLLVGASTVGAAWRFSGSEQGFLTADRAAEVWLGDEPTFATTIGGGADLDGDGDIDVVLADPSWGDAQRQGLGRALIAPARDAGLPPSATLFGEAALDNLGRAAHVVGDVDQDGREDLWLDIGGTPSLVRVRPGQGRAPVVLSIPTTSVISLPESGDFDGDGQTDLLFQAGLGAGYAYLAPPTGRLSLRDADAEGVGGFRDAINPLRASGGIAIGDFDGDGYDDAAVAFGERELDGPFTGSVRLSPGGAEPELRGYTGRIARERNADATTTLGIGYPLGAGRAYLVRISGI